MDGSLYCWVNTCTKGGTWLGRVYLGKLTLTKSGIIYYKDLNGTVHECTMGYGKNTSGTTNKARYIQVKDINGTAHSIDVYTTLYE